MINNTRNYILNRMRNIILKFYIAIAKITIIPYIALIDIQIIRRAISNRDGINIAKFYSHILYTTICITYVDISTKIHTHDSTS